MTCKTAQNLLTNCKNCTKPHQTNDRVCQDENNVMECQYDGGDCCYSDFYNGNCFVSIQYK